MYWMLPEDKEPNFLGRMVYTMVTTTFSTFINTLLACHLIEKEINKAILAASQVIWICLAENLGVILQFFDSSEITRKQSVIISINFVFLCLNVYLFVFIQKEAMNLSIFKEVDSRELKQYKQMFNTIQEGILVLEASVTGLED
jgi:hypothetical protein